MSSKHKPIFRINRTGHTTQTGTWWKFLSTLRATFSKSEENIRNNIQEKGPWGDSQLLSAVKSRTAAEGQLGRAGAVWNGNRTRRLSPPRGWPRGCPKASSSPRYPSRCPRSAGRKEIQMSQEMQLQTHRHETRRTRPELSPGLQRYRVIHVQLTIQWTLCKSRSLRVSRN